MANYLNSALFFFEMRAIQKEPSPGEVLYIHSRIDLTHSRFGVMIDRDFWREKYIQYVGREPMISDEDIPILVLGENSYYYRYSQRKEDKCIPFNLREFIDADTFPKNIPVLKRDVSLKELAKRVENGEVSDYWAKTTYFTNLNTCARNLLSDEFVDLNEEYRDYRARALEEAKVVYDYLDGARHNTNSQIDMFSKRSSLLRLLEKGIPLN